MNNSYFASFRNILQLGHRYQRKKMKKNLNSTYDNLSIVQKHVIHFILVNKDKSIYQKDIEKMLLISRSTASTMLKSLEKKGIIKRIPDKNDGRLKKLIITEEFIDEFQPIYDELEERIQEMNTQMCKGIDKADLVVFDHVLNQMKKNLQQGE